MSVPSRAFLKGRKIIGIGRNYAAHAAELSNPLPTTPVIFLKPTTSYLPSPGKIELPPRSVSNCIHHEVELGVVIGKEGRNIPEGQAMKWIRGYVLGIDLTARDVQDQAKKEGMPWAVAKGFDTFTPVSAEFPLKNPQDATINLSVNGSLKQSGSTRSMIFSIPYLISHVSRIFRLEEDDLILTGTPEGVGEVHEGDWLTGEVMEDGHVVPHSHLELTVGRREEE